MFKIAVESPLCLMEEVEKLTDYSYVLFHLTEQYSRYKYFFINKMKEGREVLLDNSAYEYYVKGEKLNLDKYAKCIEEINPTYYVLPDKLNDFEMTIYYLLEWKEKYSHLKNKTVGVIQGETFEEWLECYNIIKDECDKIAISFGYRFLPELGKKVLKSSASKSLLYAKGRQFLIEYLIDKNLIVDKPYHLLGSYLPFEFTWYKNYSFIDSIDTSFPVKNGYKDKKLTMTIDEEKEEILIDAFMNELLSQEKQEFMLNNIKIFRSKLNVWKSV